ncbi:CoA transferase [Streptomonospora sp. S1-112]|uniref:CoA transferase n=1 Tax=Streptomonospora mangrovi TaxID=2883123 RepID=A0A9X3SS81_9ACTN|nr:CoA transferase [Streptomonospora mangrovi]MDA0567821.1 CoA transferase [Streptomonospora mangrovi]
MTVSSVQGRGTGAAPLAGTAAAHRGGSAVGGVAARHLRLLGCGEVTEHGGTSAPGAPAARLVLTDPGGRGALAECVVDWAGPVGARVVDEATAQAACGIMHVHGRAQGAPAALGVDYACAVTGVLAVQGLLAAALGRLRGAGPRGVATSVAQGALLSVGQYIAAATAPDDDADEPVRPGGPPFTSADGVRFEIETLYPEGWQRFWTALGADGPALARGWPPFQGRFGTATSPLPPDLHAVVAGRLYRDVLAAARAAGVSAVRVRAGAPAPPDELDAHRPWRIAAAEGAPALLGAAGPEGAWTDPAAPGAPPPPSGAGGGPPLLGLVVVESTRRVQGPLAGHLLRLLGAEVVRVEPPGGDPLRGVPPMSGDCSARFLALNRGKRVVEIDIRSAAGRRDLRELVAGADVFLHNWAPGKAAEYRLDADDLHAVRPGLVYAYAGGWGGAPGAEGLVGTDFLVQAHSGLGALVRPEDEPPAPSLMTLTDVLGALTSVEGVLAGLLARLRTGAGQRVDTSLYDAALVLCRTALRGRGAERAWRRPRWTPLDRPLATADGHLALSARARRDPEALLRALGVGAGAPDASAAVAAHCRDHTTADLIAVLDRAGLAATEVRTDLTTFATDPAFAPALIHDGAAFVRTPWEFSP